MINKTIIHTISGGGYEYTYCYGERERKPAIKQSLQIASYLDNVRGGVAAILRAMLAKKPTSVRITYKEVAFIPEPPGGIPTISSQLLSWRPESPSGPN